MLQKDSFLYAGLLNRDILHVGGNCHSVNSSCLSFSGKDVRCIEFRYFKKIFKMKGKISKPGYLKQRIKLNPEAFRILAHHHSENFYKDSEISAERLEKTGFIRMRFVIIKLKNEDTEYLIRTFLLNVFKQMI